MSGRIDPGLKILVQEQKEIRERTRKLNVDSTPNDTNKLISHQIFLHFVYKWGPLAKTES